MMGLPEGWVTGVPGLSRTRQIRLLGNGVVPQQAAHALTVLAAWSRTGAPADDDGRGTPALCDPTGAWLTGRYEENN
jgi:DNA (cytosine-5)-methyltransferase 1